MGILPMHGRDAHATRMPSHNRASFARSPIESDASITEVFVIGGGPSDYLQSISQLMFPGVGLVDGSASAIGLNPQTILDDELSDMEVDTETDAAQFTTAAIQNNELGSLIDVVAGINASIDPDGSTALPEDATEADVADLALTFDAAQPVGPVRAGHPAAGGWRKRNRQFNCFEHIRLDTAGIVKQQFTTELARCDTAFAAGRAVRPHRRGEFRDRLCGVLSWRRDFAPGVKTAPKSCLPGIFTLERMHHLRKIRRNEQWTAPASWEWPVVEGKSRKTNMADATLPSIRTYQVFPDVPDSLQPLLEMAHNLWWVWHPDAVELFRRLDRKLWEEVYHNPVKLLGTISQAKLLEASQDEGYLAHLSRVYRVVQLSSQGARLVSRGPSADKSKMLVAYFSAEFGLHESLPIYSGGLGLLAGDHLKSASEIGLPLVGVGLLYRNGYFQQYLTSDGWQQEAYPELDFYNLPVEQMKYNDGTEMHVRVDFPDNAVFCKVWRANVGRIPLYLLDTNLAENSPADREITGKLYGGGSEMRIKQEIILGIGGVRAMEAVGVQPTVYHMNEGHAAFLALERIRMLLEHSQLSFDELRQQVMASSVFTTHTPVPAGIDFFRRI